MTDTSAETPSADAPARKRPKPGERRVQILQMLASMLEQPGGERITTAALAARLEVSEAALYRHFASKAQMFEGLIDFIEQTVFSLINQIIEKEAADPASDVGVRQSHRILSMLVQFAEKNPGMARVMVGDALVLEHERLQQRMNALFDKVEATVKQCLRDGRLTAPAQVGAIDPQIQASTAVAFVAGRLQRFARSGFKRLPSEHLDSALGLILG
ncbi:nucleoid occlusion factor SlmA [Comamonadaceae bacterium OS-4]|nr:nucleoid occlusion factor SlmA [Comamonadaceae bacterium OS-4]